jgi:hypothetical protein
MVEYIMKRKICGTFNAKCGTRDLTYVFRTVPRKAGRVVTLATIHTCIRIIWQDYMERACRTHEKDQKCIQNFSRKPADRHSSTWITLKLNSQ